MSEHTTTEVDAATRIARALRDRRDGWWSTSDVMPVVDCTPSAIRAALTAMTAVGCVERRFRVTNMYSGRYEYRWIGAGPGGVQ